MAGIRAICYMAGVHLSTRFRKTPYRAPDAFLGAFQVASRTPVSARMILSPRIPLNSSCFRLQLCRSGFDNRTAQGNIELSLCLAYATPNFRS